MYQTLFQGTITLRTDDVLCATVHVDRNFFLLFHLTILQGNEDKKKEIWKESKKKRMQKREERKKEINKERMKKKERSKDWRKGGRQAASQRFDPLQSKVVINENSQLY